MSPANVVETHRPPQGAGSATATHSYKDCGEFHATCVVTDSERGSGSASIVVRVVDVKNKHFENGFRQLAVGQVANAWLPYSRVAGANLPETGASAFAADDAIFRRGELSQRVAIGPNSTAGICQRIGANPGWHYQASAWVLIDPRRGGTCRLGLDPTGGSDATAGTVVWAATRQAGEWTQLLTVGAAGGAQITLFLEINTRLATGTPPFVPPDKAQVAADQTGAVAWFDDAALQPYQWRLKGCFNAVAKPRTACVNWKEEKRPREVESPYLDNGFAFANRVGAPLQIVLFGPLPGEGKLAIPGRGLTVTLPFPASGIQATVFAPSKTPIHLSGLAADGSEVARAESLEASTQTQQLILTGKGIVGLAISADVIEATLVELCATEDASGAATKVVKPSTGEG